MSNTYKMLIPHLSDRLNKSLQHVLTHDYIKVVNMIRVLEINPKYLPDRLKNAHELYNNYIFHNPLFANMLKLFYELVHSTDISICSNVNCRGLPSKL